MSMGVLRQSFKGRNQMAFDLQGHQLANFFSKKGNKVSSVHSQSACEKAISGQKADC